MAGNRIIKILVGATGAIGVTSYCSSGSLPTMEWQLNGLESYQHLSENAWKLVVLSVYILLSYKLDALPSDMFQYSLHSISPFASTCCSTNCGTFSGGNSMSAWLQKHMDSQLKVDTILWRLCSYFGSASVPKWHQSM